MGIYSRLLQSHPLLTKCITNGTVFGLGDAIAQSLADESDDVISWRRVTLTSFYGFAIQGPALHVWFGHLERVIPRTTVAAVTKKIIAHTMIYAPANICSFSAWAGYHKSIAEAKSDKALDNAIENAVTKAPSMWMDGNYFWLPLNAIIFSVVPLPLRPAVSNAGNILWTTYMSYHANDHIFIAMPCVATQ
ncbi:hypothetical protein AC1031_003349 [Aphanomyces cochlioides]|nr:hypothetical protein AC1031_003349 [Aphanomyces cochlioides]